jgi:hypothetical protein
MRSVRFTDESAESISVARIDEILRKGDRTDFLDLIAVLIADPLGPTATNLERLFLTANLDDPEFYAIEQFLAAYHLILALRQFAPHHHG